MSAPKASIDSTTSPFANRSQRGSFVDSTTPVMSGILYKERDHFKGWRPRYFVLDKNFLHYYLQMDDVTPRNTLQLIKGVEIAGGTEKVTARGTEYFVFTISHPMIGAPYRLSSDSKKTTDAWIAALRGVVSEQGETRYLSPVTDAERLLKRGSEDASAASDRQEAALSEASVSPVAPVNRGSTLWGIPPKLRAKVEAAAETILQGSSATAEGWVPMFEKPGVVATRKTGSGGALCVRGETVMPYTPAEIYGAFSGAKSRLELDNQLETYTRKQWLSYHTGIEYLRFKPVWPTAARDFCNLSHWRVLEDGTLLAFAFSAPFPELCPQESGLVRAELIIGGYVMRPEVGGTRVHIIVQTDLCGSIPASVASFAAQSQPMTLIALRKRLDTMYKNKSRPKFTSPVLSSFEDVLAVQKKNKDAPFPDPSRIQEDHPQPSIATAASAAASKAKPSDKATSSTSSEEAALHGIPKEYVSPVNAAVQTLLQGSSDSAEGWEPMFEKPGVVATRKAGTDGAICVRGEAVLPYTIAEIFAASSKAQDRMELDSQLHTFTRVKWFSRHTGIEYMRFKPVWPTSARDFCNLTHWRLLNDGTFVTFGFSTPFPELCPEVSGCVRANLIIAGYVMRPVVGGTRIHIIVQTDLGGSLPASVANMAAQDQPMMLVKLRKRLDKLHSGQQRPNFDAPVMSSYDELIAVTMKNKDAPYPDSDAPPKHDSKHSEKSSAAAVDRNEDLTSISSAPSVPLPQAPQALLTFPNILLLLGLPAIAYYSANGRWFGWLAVLIAFLFAVEKIMGRHLGSPARKVPLCGYGVPAGRFQFRFSADVNRLAAHGGSSDTALVGEAAVQAVALKAVSKALNAVPSVCGHIVNGYFYPCSGTDVTLLVSSAGGAYGSVTVSAACKASVAHIAASVQQQTVRVTDAGALSAIQTRLPFWLGLLWTHCATVCSAYRFTLPGMAGVVPSGVAIVSVHHTAQPMLSDPKEGKVEASFVLDAALAAAPISVCVGRAADGAPIDMGNRKSLLEKRECVVVVCVDSRLAPAAQAEVFVQKLNLYMSTPTLLDT